MFQAGDWAFVFDNLGYLLSGAGVTVVLTLAALALGFALGFPAGAIEVYGERSEERRVGKECRL